VRSAGCLSLDKVCVDILRGCLKNRVNVSINNVDLAAAAACGVLSTRVMYGTDVWTHLQPELLRRSYGTGKLRKGPSGDIVLLSKCNRSGRSQGELNILMPMVGLY
jgi:hypothetical protein